MQQKNAKMNNVEALLSSYISSPIVQKLHNYFSEPSFLDILHVDRKENYHSNFLKWLFEDANLYKKANLLLLVLLLKRAKQQSSLFPDWLETALLTNSFQIDSVKVKLENNVEDKDAKGRCDILIEMLCHRNQEEPKKIYLFIENKVYSDEHYVGKTDIKQTQFYFDKYKERYGKENCIFVYLNLISSWELSEICEPKCHCKMFVQINYQDLLDNVLTVLADDSSIEQRKSFILREYIKALSTNYSQNRGIMAIDSKLSELLISFWNNNHTLIELSIEALADDPNLDDEVHEEVNNLKKSVKQLANKRDDTQYVFKEKVYKVKMSLVRDVLEDLGNNQTDVNGKWEKYLNNLNLDDFDKLFSPSYKWTKDNHELPDNEKKEIIKNGRGLKRQSKSLIGDRDDEKNYDASGFYRQWGWKNFDYFIKFCRECLKLDIKVL